MSDFVILLADPSRLDCPREESAMPRVAPLVAALRSRAGCLAVAIVVAVLFPSRVVAEESWVTVLRDDDRGVELLLQAPDPVRRGRNVRVPGFGTSGDAGFPLHYAQALLLAVPGAGGARLEVLAREERQLAGVEPEWMPHPPARGGDPGAFELGVGEGGVGSAAAGIGAGRPAVRRSWSGLYPSSAISVVRRGMIRGRHVVSLRFAPLRFDASGGAHYVHSARVRITFADRARPRSIDAGIDPLHATLLNTETAARWELHFERRPQRPRPFALTSLPSQRLRVRVGRTGVYELTYDQLLAAGVPVDNLDPTTFQMFFERWHPIALFADSTPASWEPDYELQESALWVDGEANRTFEVGERVVFYALGPRDYVDRSGASADSLEHAQHPYDRFNYGWLVWDVQPGLRMQQVSAAVSGTPTQVVDRSHQRFHFEEDRQFERVDDLWLWEEIRQTRPALVQFELDTAGLDTVSGDIRIGLAAGLFRSSRTRRIVVRLNGQIIDTIQYNQPFSFPPPEYFTIPATFQATNQLQFSIAPDDTLVGPQMFFLKFDVVWERPLVRPTRGPDTDLLRWTRMPATAAETFELGGFGATEPWVFDVTDPLRAVRLVDAEPQGSGSATLWWLRYGRGPGARTRFLATSQPARLQPADLVLRNVVPLRERVVAPDMLIVTHASLHAEAVRLAQHRRAQFPGLDTLGTAEVLVVDVEDVYDNFSGGRVDPLAIRNYAKFLYGLVPPGETQSRLRYLLLFGDATHDPRRVLPGTTPTLVPTVQPWYADVRTGREYAVDDWLAEMETPDLDVALTRVHPVPDLAIGRVTPRTTGEARRIVDKFIAYDNSTDYGAWRTRIILAADDETTPSRDREAFHITGTEGLVGLTPPEWDIVKLYLTEYPRTLGQKPEGRAAFIRAWSEGCALVNYQGHGAPRQLADEVLFLASDIPSLTNGTRLPVFMAFSCTVSEFDAPQLQSMSEDMVTSAAGGAVATMGATTPTFATPNARYNGEVWESMFAAGATSKTPFGIMHQQAKSASGGFDGVNNETYVLLGDPAMTLQAPEYLIDVSDRTDPLEAGRSAQVQCIVRDTAGIAVPGFNGFADVEVLGTADESGYTKPNDPTFHIAYDLRGSPIYRATVPVTNGRFNFSFFMPIDARLGSKARISAYAYAPAARHDAKGANGAVPVVQAAEPEPSTGPPRITLRFPNNVTKVKPGTPLVGEIRDENGINIQGTSLPSSILLDFDEQSQPLNVTALFRYEQGSDSVGTVTVPLPGELPPGPHSATLIASDNLRNQSMKSIHFEVVSEAVELMSNVIAFPNPFKDRTHFFFELTDPSDVLVRVYTSTGREVWRHQGFVSEPQQVSIRWEGVDRTGDELANGTYIYRLEARPRRPPHASGATAAGPVLAHVGKVVIMRD